MKEFPAFPPPADAPDELFESGHLWLLEGVRGAPLRFAPTDAGWLAFGDRESVYRDSVPIEHRFAAEHVRERIDRAALAEVPSGATFFGVATRFEGVEYEWDRLPPFVGTEVWSPERGSFLPPDAAERAFRGLNLSMAPAIEKEVPARHFGVDAFDPPRSAWRDGPPAELLLRNKRGERAVVPIAEPASPPPNDDPADLAERYASAARIEAAVEAERSDGTADYDAVRRRVVDSALREGYAAFVPRDRSADVDAVVEAIDRRVRHHLAESDVDLR